MVESQQKSTAGYLILFFSDVENLTNQYSTLDNTLIHLRGLTKSKTFLELRSRLDAVPESNRIDLINKFAGFRWYATRCYVKFNALKQTYPIFNNNKTLDDLYPKICGETAPDFPEHSDIKSFVLQMNQLFGNQIVREALETTADRYGSFLMDSGGENQQ